MTEQDILKRTFDYVAAGYNSGETSFSVDDGLLEQGIIDSQGLIDLITFLETDFAIVIDDDDVDLENFSTIKAISRFVATKLDQ